MEFTGIHSQYQRLKSKIDHRIQQVLEHHRFILGPEVEQLEKELANYVGSKHCIGVGNGTDALLIALMALEIGPEDEVITTPFSFFATAEVILALGAKPIFVDIDPLTYNIDVSLIEATITSRTKAIIPVNLYGQCANYDAIYAIAKAHGLSVIEDAAQSFGAMYKGKLSCTLGDISCTSFFPTKPLGAYGDGGACFTDNDKLAEKIRQISCHGESEHYKHNRLGVNSRLDTLQAAILLEKLAVFKEELENRQRVAKMYNEKLPEEIITPVILNENISSYGQYTIRCKFRDKLKTELAKHNIPSAIHYPLPMYKQPAINTPLNLEQSELAAQEVLSLPFHPYLEVSEIEKVSTVIKEFVSETSDVC